MHYCALTVVYMVPIVGRAFAICSYLLYSGMYQLGLYDGGESSTPFISTPWFGSLPPLSHPFVAPTCTAILLTGT